MAFLGVVDALTRRADRDCGFESAIIRDRLATDERPRERDRMGSIMGGDHD